MRLLGWDIVVPTGIDQQPANIPTRGPDPEGELEELVSQPLIQFYNDLPAHICFTIVSSAYMESERC